MLDMFDNKKCVLQLSYACDHNASHSVMYLEGKLRYIHVESLLHVIRACVYVNSSLQASSSHWEHHHQ
jgi:hypothetical protein